jgi:hypothetical protein
LVFSVRKNFGFQQSRADRFGSKLKTDVFGFGLLLQFFGFNRTDRNPYPCVEALPCSNASAAPSLCCAASLVAASLLACSVPAAAPPARLLLVAGSPLPARLLLVVGSTPPAPLAARRRPWGSCSSLARRHPRRW